MYDEEDIVMSKDVRYYRVPKLNWGETSYYTIVNLKSEPPLTRNLRDAELKSVMIDNAWQVPLYSCHTQAVEKAIKIVSDASSQVYGDTERDGFIRQHIRPRKLMPKVDMKRDLQALLGPMKIRIIF